MELNVLNCQKHGSYRLPRIAADRMVPGDLNCICGGLLQGDCTAVFRHLLAWATSKQQKPSTTAELGPGPVFKVQISTTNQPNSPNNCNGSGRLGQLGGYGYGYGGARGPGPSVG